MVVALEIDLNSRKMTPVVGTPPPKRRFPQISASFALFYGSSTSSKTMDGRTDEPCQGKCPYASIIQMRLIGGGGHIGHVRSHEGSKRKKLDGQDK